MKKIVAFCCAIMMMLSVCGCSSQPPVTAKNEETQKLIDNIERVKSVKNGDLQKAIICYNDDHHIEGDNDICQGCIEITDGETLKEMHGLLKDMTYSVEPVSNGDRSIGTGIYPLYFVIDGKMVFAGWWNNHLIYHHRTTYLVSKSELLKVDEKNALAMAKILKEHYEYRPVDKEKVTLNVIEKVTNADNISEVAILSYYGGVSREYRINEYFRPELTATLKKIVVDMEITPYPSQLQTGENQEWCELVFNIDGLLYTVSVFDRTEGGITIGQTRGGHADKTGFWYTVSNYEETVASIRAVLDSLPKNDSF